jgi:hypothetical protein
MILLLYNHDRDQNKYKLHIYSLLFEDYNLVNRNGNLLYIMRKKSNYLVKNLAGYRWKNKMSRTIENLTFAAEK